MSTTNIRPELARHLAQRLQAFSEGFRHNLALIGPSGSGKTFQLQQLLERAPATLLRIYCPLYRESPRSQLTRLLCAILQGGLATSSTRAGSEEPTHGPATPSLEALLQRADRELPRTASAMRAVELLMVKRLYAEAFTRTLDTIPLLTEECGRSCVFILDEFLYLEETGFAHAFHELGKRVMTWPSTLFVLTSSAPYRSREILRERLQLLFGQFELLVLDAPNPATTMAWIQQELRGIRRAKTMVPFLLQWLGAYPWYLAVFLRRLRELVMLHRSPEVTEELFLQTAWDVLGHTSGALHQWCVSRITGLTHQRIGTRALEGLIQIAEGARTTTDIGKRIGRARLSAALQLLVEQDLAQRSGMCWVITDPILRCWLSTVMLTQQRDARIDATDARARFERYVRLLWIAWSDANRRSFPEQVIGLFGKFTEEMISLDSKTGRLPRFETIRAHPQEPDGPETYLIAEGQGSRWCAAVHDGPPTEQAISSFDAFCKTQTPKPSRKIVIAKAALDENARLLAKASNMWVWSADDLRLLTSLYGH